MKKVFLCAFLLTQLSHVFSQSPGGVSANLQLWLKADAGTSCATDGCNVTTWADQSVNARTATRGGGTGTLELNEVNFNAVIDAQDLAKNFSVPSFTGQTIYYAGRANTSGNLGCCNGYLGFEGDRGIRQAIDNTDEYRSNGAGGDGGDWSFGSTFYYNGVGDAVNNISGIDEFHVGGAQRTASHTNTFYLGGYYDGNRYFDESTYYGDVIIYSSTITAVERVKIESYLAIKYGITLGSVASSVTYKNASNATIWTGSATYQNDIAGIGRDDGSALDQRKSKSENSDAVVTMALVDNGGSFAAPNQATVNQSFLVWGNDGGTGAALPRSIQSELPATYYHRLDREWRVEETGTIGNVALTFDLSLAQIPGVVASDFTLLVDTDGDADFTTGGPTAVAASSLVSGVLSFNAVNFSSGNVFTLASVGAAPGGVSDAVTSWFKADAGTTGAPTVTSWANQISGIIGPLTNVSDPNLATDALNFNPVIEFDSDDALRDNGFTGDQLLDQDDNTMVMVGKYTSGTVFLQTQQPFTPGNRYGFESSGTKLRVDWPGDGSINVSTSDINDAYHIMLSNTAATGDSIFMEGLLESAQVAAGSINSTTSWEITVGASYPNINRAVVNSSEIVVFGSRLSTIKRNRVESYLGIKYGISLGTTASIVDYNDASGNTVWSGDATYQNDIAGIGRDDRSALEQDKSQSQNSDRIVTMALTDQGGSFASPDAFDADQEFLIWGNDNGSTNEQSTEAPSNILARLGREWKVQETGTVGSLDIEMDVSALTVTGVSPSDFVLLIDTDNDGDFTTGTITQVAATSYSAGVAQFNAVDFSNNNVFTLATLAVSPGGVSVGLGAWYKADGNVTTAGSALTRWDNEVGAATALTTIGSDPAIVSTGINFNDYAEFDGNDQIYGAADGTDFVSANESSFLIAMNYKSGAVIAKWEEDVNNRIAYEGNGSKLRHDRPGVTSIMTSVADVQNLWTLATTVCSVTTDSLMLNGLLDNTNASGVNDPTQVSTIQFGGNTDGAFPAEVDIAEVIFYTERLSDENRNRAESYLAIKYGMTLGTTADVVNYKDSDGTVIWTGSATYQNDVAGLGRDDLSGLDQRKSLSINSDAIVTMGLIDNGGTFASPNQATADESFLIWGNDNGVLAEQVTETPSSKYRRIGREWTVSEKGTIGNVLIAVDISGLGLSGTVNTDYALLVDTDSDFSDATTILIADSLSGDVVYFVVNFSDGDFFTLVTVPVAPGGVSENLGLWLEANAGTNCTTAGCYVTNWEDQSPLNNNATNTGDAYLTLNEINYNPIIDAYDLDRLFSTPSLTGRTIYYAGFGGTSGTFGCCNGYLGFNGDKGFRQSTNNSSDYLSNGAGSNGDDWSNGSTFYYDGLANSGSNIEEFSDFHIGSATRTSAHTNTFFIGGYESGRYFDETSYYGDVIVYSGTHTAIQRQKVQTYLAIKYGLTLGSTASPVDYINSNGSTIWSGSATYQNDVIGLMRDDASGFLQKQSHSFDDTLKIFISTFASGNDSNAGTVTNDQSSIVIGHDGGYLKDTLATSTEVPAGIEARFNREWRVTNTSFADSYSLDIEWDSVGTFDITHIRLLVDDDGDFTDATVYSAADGLAFSLGSIVINGITTTHIPLNSTRFITIGSVSSNTPLPVELLSFDAYLNESDDVELKWETAKEVNNDYFIIQHSEEGKHWSTVDVVQGAGNSGKRQDYYAKDNHPVNGDNYYRLKQVDYDGRFDYSETRIVVFLPEVVWGLYPNPTDGIVIVEFENELRNASFEVTNSKGVKVDVIVRKVGDLKYELNLIDCPSGTYFVKTNYSQDRHVEKVIKR